MLSVIQLSYKPSLQDKCILKVLYNWRLTVIESRIQ